MRSDFATVFRLSLPFEGHPHPYQCPLFSSPQSHLMALRINLRIPGFFFFLPDNFFIYLFMFFSYFYLFFSFIIFFLSYCQTETRQRSGQCSTTQRSLKDIYLPILCAVLQLTKQINRRPTISRFNSIFENELGEKFSYLPGGVSNF